MADTYTSGSIPKQMAQLAAPLIAGNIFQQLYNTTQNFGAGKNERVKKCFLTGQAYALALGAVSAIVMYFSAGTTAGFMLGEYSGAAYENAAEYLQTVALFYVLCFTGSAFV